MTLHLLRISAVITLLVLCTFYPFLPGEYDSLAVPLSALAQTFGLVGLLLVPVGGFWLGYELRNRSRGKSYPATKAAGRYYLALAATVASAIVAIVLSLVSLMTVGISLGLVTLALWVYIAVRLKPELKSLKTAEANNFNPAPLYLVLVPAIVLIFQVTLASYATDFSRNRAIAQSAELIGEIERHRAAHGRYPGSLLALHEDYKTSVIGIEQFHYAPNGEAYNLFFERPASLLDFGIREIVMYNKLDQHLAMSHAAWILEGSPEQLEARQGWHSVQDSASPHWKYFWFD